jgi:tetratricopeptide (TPR) repeat protein
VTVIATPAGSEKRAPEAAAPYRLEGRVGGSSAQLRVTLSLTDAETGAQVWTERFDGAAEGALDLQDHIAATIVERVEYALLLAEAQRAETMPPHARGPHELFYLALTRALRFHRASIEEAVVLLQDALAREPDLPRICVATALCHSILYQSGWSTNPAETRRLGIELGRRALSAAERDIVVLRGFASAEVAWGEDLTAVIAIVERGLARAPKDSVLTICLGYLKAVQGGDPAGALTILDGAHALAWQTPNVPFILFCRGICLFLLKDFDAAAALIREALVLRPEYLFAQAVLTSVLAHAGHLAQARAVGAEIRDPSQLAFILAIFRNADERGFVRRGLELAGVIGVGSASS